MLATNWQTTGIWLLHFGLTTKKTPNFVQQSVSIVCPSVCLSVSICIIYLSLCLSVSISIIYLFVYLSVSISLSLSLSPSLSLSRSLFLFLFFLFHFIFPFPLSIHLTPLPEKWTQDKSKTKEKFIADLASRATLIEGDLMKVAIALCRPQVP